ncbi:MAG: sulfatase-like hydrolase/transferase [Parasphingorhabdus sp.]|uniref:sulfatase-like hydrolase/transferase n=1 Tax=Parasphingorhabdus sp. TaxID=2709688 RepID=UPI003296AA16
MTMERRFSFPKDELSRFFNWIFVWIILANAGFMAMWFVGAPPRYLEIGIIGFTGLIVKRFAPWFQWIAFVAVLSYSMLSFVGGLFNLNIYSLIYSLQFFAELKPDSSMEYIIVAVLAVVTMIVAFWLLRRDSNFSHSLLILIAGGLIMGLAATDFAMGQGMRGHYKRSAPAGALFESATGQTEFAARADGKRHLILVMVESLGVPKDNPIMADKLFAYYNNSAIKRRYDVSQGTSLYYNSTTAGEVREMCGRWGDYYELVEQRDDGCLPAQLAKQGYATHAMHSFQGGFFKRNQWYPNIGFEKQEFWKDLQKQGIEWCGGVFAGACDRQIPKLLAENLKQAKQPTFMYWLTLNAHLPVPTGLNLNVDNCEKVSPELAKNFPMICRQFSLFDDIDKALIKEITASDFPEADILIVGDHMPPYYDRHHRSQFDPERVPWLYLKHKDASASES